MYATTLVRWEECQAELAALPAGDRMGDIGLLIRKVSDRQARLAVTLGKLLGCTPASEGQDPARRYASVATTRLRLAAVFHIGNNMDDKTEQLARRPHASPPRARATPAVLATVAALSQSVLRHLHELNPKRRNASSSRTPLVPLTGGCRSSAARH